MKKVFIADDHEMFRMGLRTLLGTLDSLQLVGEAGTGAETLARLRQTPVDLLILDHSMPDGTGLEVLQALQKEALLNLDVILLTANQSPLIFQQAVEAGVSGVVTKSGSGEELLLTIEQVLASNRYLTPAASKILKTAPGLGELTRRETEVMLALLEGLELQQIADSFSVSYKTIETHKTRLMSKLGVHSSQTLLALARRTGLLSDQ